MIWVFNRLFNSLNIWRSRLYLLQKSRKKGQKKGKNGNFLAKNAKTWKIVTFCCNSQHFCHICGEKCNINCYYWECYKDIKFKGIKWYKFSLILQYCLPTQHYILIYFATKPVKYLLHTVIFLFFVHTVTFCKASPDTYNFFYPKLTFFKAF